MFDESWSCWSAHGESAMFRTLAFVGVAWVSSLREEIGRLDLEVEAAAWRDCGLTLCCFPGKNSVLTAGLVAGSLQVINQSLRGIKMSPFWHVSSALFEAEKRKQASDFGEGDSLKQGVSFRLVEVRKCKFEFFMFFFLGWFEESIITFTVFGFSSSQEQLRSMNWSTRW